MGRPRQYAGDAERQRACRQRREAETVRVERRALEGLHMRLERLQQAIWRAADAGDATARAGPGDQRGDGARAADRVLRGVCQRERAAGEPPRPAPPPAPLTHGQNGG